MRVDEPQQKCDGGQDRDEQQVVPETADLAARLRRQAVQLAVRYPARRPAMIASPVTAEARSVRFARAKPWAALAAAAGLLGAAIPLLWEAAPLTPVPAHRQVGASVARPAGDAADRDRLGHPLPKSERLAAEATEPRLASPSPVSDVDAPGFLMNVSTPELEALLDLWEKDRSETTRLSI